MKKFLYLGCLLALFMVTSAESCEDCDELCVEQLEECDLELQSAEAEINSLNNDVQFIAAFNLASQGGRICPPPCRGPSPCDICAGCDVALCKYFFDLSLVDDVVVTIYEDSNGQFGQVIGNSMGPNSASNNVGFTDINIVNPNYQGDAFIVVEQFSNGQMVSSETIASEWIIP